MTKIIVGRSAKRPGPEQYSSDGYHLTVELEKEVATPEDFHQSVRSLFAEVKAALHAEIAHASGQDAAQRNNRHDLWTGGSNDGRSRQRADSGHERSGGNGSAAISNKQARYLTQLLARKGISQQDQVSAYLRQSLGVTVSTIYDLDKATASQAIESLKANQGENQA